MSLSSSTSSSTDRITCGCTSSSTSVSSVPLTVSPGVKPCSSIVSSISSNRSSTGVSLSAAVPERAFAAIVTTRSPLSAKSSPSTAVPASRSVTGIGRGRTWSVGSPSVAVTVTVCAPPSSAIEPGETDSSMAGESMIAKSAGVAKYGVSPRANRSVSLRLSLTPSSSAVRFSVVEPASAPAGMVICCGPVTA